MNAMKLFSWITKPQRDLEASIDGVHNIVKEQREQINALTAQNELLRERVQYLELMEKDLRARETSIESYAVDFDKLNAFSVERQFDDKGNPYTTIGWLDQNSVSQEWYLYANQDAHEQLVKEFRAHLDRKVAQTWFRKGTLNTIPPVE